MSKHTQGRFRVLIDECCKIVSDDGSLATMLYCNSKGRLPKGVTEANAQHIVTCVNQHEALKAKADIADKLMGVWNKSQGCLTDDNVIEGLSYFIEAMDKENGNE